MQTYNLTYPLLRASSYSCCGNITQMQAEKGKKNKINYRCRWHWFCLCWWLLRALHMRCQQSALCMCMCIPECAHAGIHVCTCVSSYCCDLHGAVNHSLPSPLTPPSSPLISFTARGDVIACWWSTNQTNPHSPASKYWRAEISLFLWPLYFSAPTSCLHARAPGGLPVARGQIHRSSSRTRSLWPNLSPAH